METVTNEKAVAAASDKDGSASKIDDVNSNSANSASSSSLPQTISDEEKKELEDQWKTDLARLEYEIQTLRNVLIAKIDEAEKLKKKLGITPMVELKQDVMMGIQTIKESETVKKTNAALRSFGDYASKKLVDLRNSNTFKSVEGKVGGAYSNVKKRVSVSKVDDDTSEPSSPPQPTSPTLELESYEVGEELANMLPETEKSDTPPSAVEKQTK